MKPVLILFYCIAVLTCCKNNSSTENSKDTARRVASNQPPADSTATASEEEEADCYSRFFEPATAIDSNNIVVTTSEGKTYKLPKFIDEQGLERQYTNISFKDLDKDATQELWIRN